MYPLRSVNGEIIKKDKNQIYQISEVHPSVPWLVGTRLLSNSDSIKTHLKTCQIYQDSDIKSEFLWKKKPDFFGV
jgi:hypothetical protein